MGVRNNFKEKYGGLNFFSEKKYAFAIFVVLKVVNYGGLKIFSLKIWGAKISWKEIWVSIFLPFFITGYPVLKI